MTKLAEILQGANSACFTVCFNLKVNDKAVNEKLASVTQAEIKDKKKALDLAKEIL